MSFKYIENIYINGYISLSKRNIFLSLGLYGAPGDIDVERSTLWLKYFHHFTIFKFYNIFTKKYDIKMFKTGFQLMTFRLVANAKNH